jgi:hypothetical protein
MTSSKNSFDSLRVTIRDIRRLRKTADFLTNNADQHRIALIQHLGLKRYIFNVLGQTAHHPSAGCLLLWPDAVERVNDTGANLGEYLYARAQKEQRLPQAILTDGEKFYL